MISTTFGAVAVPNLVDVMGEFAIYIGIPALAGPCILAATAYILAGCVLLMLLRPDPFIVAKAISDDQTAISNLLLEENSNLLSINRRGIFSGASVMVLTQFVLRQL